MYKTNQKGQSLMELIVVVAVMVIVIGALVFATIASLRNAQFAKNQAQATKLAQEAIERVRIGRDRDLAVTVVGQDVISWNGISGSGAFWNYHIFGDCEKREGFVENDCYFTVNSEGELQNLGSFADFPENAESIPPPPEQSVFKRVVIISDRNFTGEEWKNTKEVTVLVKWVDFSGEHESRLTSILRNSNK